jgi:hypothetical protein
MNNLTHSPVARRTQKSLSQEIASIAGLKSSLIDFMLSVSVKIHQGQLAEESVVAASWIKAYRKYGFFVSGFDHVNQV